MATVTVQPNPVTIAVGTNTQATATLRNAAGDVVTGNVSWTSDNQSIATITSSGSVHAVAVGQTMIRATSGSKSGTATVVVIESSQIAAPDAGDYAIYAQWTQATQSPDGTIPMVLGGNGAALNVLVAANVTTQRDMQIVMRLFSANGTLTRADTQTVSVPAQNLAPTYVAPSAQFRLLPSELVPGMRWQVARDPKGVVTDLSAATDVFPRSGPQTLAMVNVPALKVRFVPIVLSMHNNATGKVNAGNLSDYTRTIESAHPIGAFEAIVGANFTTSQSFGTPPDQGGFATAFWQPVLVQLDLARVADPDPSVYWVGVVLPPSGFNKTNNGGIGYVPSNGSATGPGTRTNMVTSIDWASDPAFTRVTVAHELGHNFGRPHAPCGPADNTDPNFPYPGGTIGVPGHDVRGWMAGRAPTAVAMPPSFFDLMGYCTPGVQNWISDYNYRLVLNFRTFTGAGAVVPPSLVKLEPITRVILVSGSVDDAAGISLNPTFSVDAHPSRQENTGPYHIEGRSNTGALLFEYDFAPSVIDHLPNTGHFAFAIPMSADNEASLATIDVRGPAGTARMERPRVAASLRAPGSVAPQRINGMVSIACEDANARGVIVRDARGVMLGMATGSTAQVAVNPGTQLQVVCSDGLVSSRRAVIAP